jgi:hypothetical protein
LDQINHRKQYQRDDSREKFRRENPDDEGSEEEFEEEEEEEDSPVLDPRSIEAVKRAFSKKVKHRSSVSLKFSKKMLINF